MCTSKIGKDGSDTGFAKSGFEIIPGRFGRSGNIMVEGMSKAKRYGASGLHILGVPFGLFGGIRGGTRDATSNMEPKALCLQVGGHLVGPGNPITTGEEGYKSIDRRRH